MRKKMPLRRLTLAEYHRLVDMGFFVPNERVELINGYIVEMSPIRPPHAAAVTNLDRDAFTSEFLGRCSIRCQAPILLESRGSEPEPDIVSLRRILIIMPIDVRGQQIFLLVVEKFQTHLYATIRQRRNKNMLPRAFLSIWILNLMESVLEVYQNPFLSEAGTADYHARFIYVSRQNVAPLAFPDSQITLNDIFPAVN